MAAEAFRRLHAQPCIFLPDFKEDNIVLQLREQDRNHANSINRRKITNNTTLTIYLLHRLAGIHLPSNRKGGPDIKMNNAARSINLAIKLVSATAGLVLFILFYSYHYAGIPACTARMAKIDDRINASDLELSKLSSANRDTQCRYFRPRFELLSRNIALIRECRGAKYAGRIAFEAHAYEKLAASCVP